MAKIQNLMTPNVWEYVEQRKFSFIVYGDIKMVNKFGIWYFLTKPYIVLQFDSAVTLLDIY